MDVVMQKLEAAWAGTSIGGVEFLAILLLFVVVLVVEKIRARMKAKWLATRGIRPEITTLRRLTSELEIRGIENVTLPGRRNGRLDYALRLPASLALVVLGPRDAHGELQLRAKGQAWSWHEFGHERMVFSPMPRVRQVVNLFKQSFKFVKVRVYFVMPSTLTLPSKGLPPNVVRIDSLPQLLRQAVAEDHANRDFNEDMLDDAWRKLVAKAESQQGKKQIPGTGNVVIRS